jgi:REP element-mobilizing transposase RayT
MQELIRDCKLYPSNSHMSVRRKIWEPNGVFFITFTCARWVPLFQLTNGYSAVYTWFDYLKQQGHYIAGYVIMPNHVHALIAFSTGRTPINTIVANGKRFMAYDLVKRLKELGKNEVLEQLASWVNKTERLNNKRHEVFEPSFDWKECRTIAFMEQKANYIHLNPCKERIVNLPEDYAHSSAKYYFTGEQGEYPVITYMELQDIDLTL